VADDDLEPGTDGEVDEPDERVLEADAVNVVVAGRADEFAGGAIRSDEAIEYGEFNRTAGHDLRWRFSPGALLAPRVNVALDEPAREPSAGDLINRRFRLSLKRRSDRRQVDLAGDTKMFQALANAPTAGIRLPVELLVGESSDEGAGALIIRIKFGRQAE